MFAPAMRRKDFLNLRSNGIVYRWSYRFPGYKISGTLQKRLNQPTCTVSIDMDPPSTCGARCPSVKLLFSAAFMGVPRTAVPPLGAAEAVSNTAAPLSLMQ